MSRTLILESLFPSHPRAPAEPVARGLVPRLVPATPAQPSRKFESRSGLHQLAQDHGFWLIM